MALVEIRRKKVKIPSPPKSCIKLRQKIIDFGIESRPVKTVIPVVVKPLTASKKESIKDFSIPIINGRAPKIETMTQPKAHNNIAVVKSM